MAPEVQGTFISEKINKVRWLPEEYEETQYFVTGSYDNQQTTNTLKFWMFDKGSDDEECGSPRTINTYSIDGDVTELQLIGSDKLVVSTSRGSVKLLHTSNYDKSAPIKELNCWDDLHGIGDEPFSCSSVATLDSDIVSVGEDGSINTMNANRNEVTRTLPQADSCSLLCVSYIKHNEIITGNLRGVMKIWDLRAPENKPTVSFALSNIEQAAMCVIHHPTQYHMVLAGSEGGSLSVWDLRINTYPASLLNGHTLAVNELQFHPEKPEKLFSCSASGEIWEWNMGAMTQSNLQVKNENSGLQVTNSWLTVDEDKTKLMVTPLMPNLHKPINGLDCNRNRVLCGADNEAIYLIKKLSI